MPKRTDIKKIMVLGAGPIVIGQACEFDYSGTQGCKALKEEGYEVILVYIHLQSTQLNEARVRQRVIEGGHDVPAEKIHGRIPRTVQYVAAALPLVDEARLLDNSLGDDPFRQVAIVRKGVCVWATEPLSAWVRRILPQ